MVRSNATTGDRPFLHHLLCALAYGLVGTVSLLAFLAAVLIGSGAFGW
jgi:hypothetical protein